jgi:predicted dehydrogenase
MKSTPTKVALVGAGAIARRHAALLSSDGLPGLELGGVYDTRPESARELVEAHGGKVYESLPDLAGDPGIGLIAILTPSGTHASLVSELARYGKPIVVEKPMALRLEDADEIIRECDRHGVRLFVVKQNRFNPPVVKLHEAVASGRFGKLVLGTVRLRWCRDQAYYDQASWRGTWEHDGGVLTNQASHHIDLLLWMMGEVESVFAMATTALVDIEAEDTAVVTIRFRNGALGVIEATTATRPKDLEGSLSVLGEKGAVEIGGFAANRMKTWQFADANPGDETVFEDDEAVTSHPLKAYAHEQFYRHVVECLETGSRQLIDGLEGRRSLEVISAIYESIETGREVSLRFKPRQCRLGQKMGE